MYMRAVRFCCSYTPFIDSVCPDVTHFTIIWKLLYDDSCPGGNQRFNQNFNIRRRCN